MQFYEAAHSPPERLSFGMLLLYGLAAVALISLCGGAVVVGNRMLFGPAPELVAGQVWPLRIWLAYLALAGAIAVAYGLQVRFVERRPCSELALRPAVAETGVGAALGIIFAALVVLLLAVTGCYRIVGWHSPFDLAAPALMAIGAGVMEEIIARGFVLGLIERWAGSGVALVSSAILFGAAHIENTGAGAWPVIALSLGAGVTLGAAYLATRRLWLPIGLHFGWNFAQSALFGLLDSGASFPSLIDARIAGPGWLTGGAFGPEASVPGLAVWVLFGVVLLFRAVRRNRIVPWRSSRSLEVPC
ncbi:MAG TPA: CPBP family intramembrane glutamic endopeptidase [Aliidongia sp.]|uniref:CPBP family intramembrane glutamic endopeptidase n=1 Tax=Aliidongia sp. TaxID=1914230 RepID=UPI002DDD1165|nr:CPBP family intramembrane glutamic endopeptidase [Aliidongia sp.]HEV2676692.1 CPBP family intramembrane glutamic endopeptidase [Aliidongia sp.]